MKLHWPAVALTAACCLTVAGCATPPPAPPSVASLTFVAWEQPIGCGGVAVFPGDIIVADADGAVLIPADMADAIADECVEQERLEAWIMVQVESGQALPGLYPSNAENKARYDADKAAGRA